MVIICDRGSGCGTLIDVQVAQFLNSSAEEVWATIVDWESYPRLMECVRSVEILERSTLQGGITRCFASWEVELKGSILRWTEEEIQRPDLMLVEFTQVDGDLEKFEGYWSVSAISDSTCEASLLVRFDIGIPLLADMLNPVAKRAIEENSRNMLQSLSLS